MQKVERKKISVYISSDTKSELEEIKRNNRELPSLNSIIVEAIKIFLLKQKNKKTKEK
jgi:hypothetical protein